MPMNKHLCALWEQRGYPKMGSAAVVPPPPLGFRRLYHLMSADYAITSLVFKRLKAARFSDLNDPFELLAHRSAHRSDREVFSAHKAKLNDEIGLLCFSENWVDPYFGATTARNIAAFV
jgi:hypothetical protein